MCHCITKTIILNIYCSYLISSTLPSSGLHSPHLLSSQLSRKQYFLALFASTQTPLRVERARKKIKKNQPGQCKYEVIKVSVLEISQHLHNREKCISKTYFGYNYGFFQYIYAVVYGLKLFNVHE